MTYKDVALVNSSLDQLSDTLLKQRMLDQQQQEKQAELGVRSQALNAQAASRAATETERTRHNTAMETNAGNVTEQKRKQNAQQMWGDTVKMYGDWVDKGIMAPDQAQSILQQSYNKMPDTAKQYVADHPSVQALQSGKPLFKAAPEKGAGFNTAPIANKRKWDEEYKKADDLEAQAKSENDLTSTQRQVLLEQAAKTRKTADEFFKPKQATPDEDKATVTVGTKPEGESGPTVSERLTPKAYQERRASSLKQKKADRANAIAKENPKLTRDQIISQVEKEFAGKQ